MTTAARIPRWTIWSVAAGFVVTVAVTLAMGGLSADEPLDTTDLGRYLLRDADLPGEFAFVVVFDSVDLTLDPRSGATSATSTVLTTDDPDPASAPAAVAVWAPGARIVVSEVLDFDSGIDARDHLGAIWAEYKLGALERQRGPDGSLLVFHPEFERRPAAQAAPVGVAAWAVDTTVLTITYVGAESSMDVLELARIVEARHTGGGS